MDATKSRYRMDDPNFDAESGVLKNKLKIVDAKQLESQEKEQLIKAYDQAAREYSETHTFAVDDVCYLHRLFLGEIFEWAGNYRNVDIASKDIRYCHAPYIASEMQRFSHRLVELTPFAPELSKRDITLRLAEIHGELIVIHPFRDGNGRTTRLLCDLLLMQAEYRPMKIANFYNESFRLQYHQAIQHTWHTGDYEKLRVLFEPMILF